MVVDVVDRNASASCVPQKLFHCRVALREHVRSKRFFAVVNEADGLVDVTNNDDW